MPNPQSYELTVHQARYVDVYTDAIRVHKDERCGVDEGRICKVTVVDGASWLFAMRGLPDSDRGYVRLDDIGREHLGLKRSDRRKFTFREATYFEALRWATKASQPGIRIATWIALLSVGLGVLGTVLAIIGLWIAANASH